MKKVFLFFVLIILMLILSREVFDRLHLYDEFIWLDIPMHLLGGFLLSGLFGSIALYKKKKPSYVLILSLFFIVASFWELYEYFIRQVTERSWYGFFDTVKDYCMGGIGASIGFSFISKKKHI